jgi:hypothetical protein
MYTLQGYSISKEKLIIAFLLMFILLEAAWVPFRANKIKKKTEIKVISSTEECLILHSMIQSTCRVIVQMQVG